MTNASLIDANAQQAASWSRRHAATVAAGSSDIFVIPEWRGAVSVAVHPGAGGSALVEYTLSPRAAVESGTAKWLPWGYGSVSESTADVLLGPVTALRFTATVADADFEVVA